MIARFWIDRTERYKVERLMDHGYVIDIVKMSDDKICYDVIITNLSQVGCICYYLDRNHGNWHTETTTVYCIGDES